MEEERRQKIYELIASVIFMIFSVFMYIVAAKTKVNLGSYASKEMHPFVFPKIILGVMFFCALCCFLFTVRWFVKNKTDKKVSVEELFPKKSVVTFGLLLVYLMLWKIIGFILSTFIYSFFQTKYLERNRSTKQILLVSGILSVGLYLLFAALFKVKLPEPIFELIF